MRAYAYIFSLPKKNVNLEAFAKKKSFGVPNWILGAGILGIGYLMMQGFPNTDVNMSLKKVGGSGKCSGKCGGPCFRCSGSNQIGLCQDSGCAPRQIKCSCIDGKALPGQIPSAGGGGILEALGSLFKGAPAEEIPVG